MAYVEMVPTKTESKEIYRKDTVVLVYHQEAQSQLWWQAWMQIYHIHSRNHQESLALLPWLPPLLHLPHLGKKCLMNWLIIKFCIQKVWRV